MTIRPRTRTRRRHPVAKLIGRQVTGKTTVRTETVTRTDGRTEGRIYLDDQELIRSTDAYRLAELAGHIDRLATQMARQTV